MQLTREEHIQYNNGGIPSRNFRLEVLLSARFLFGIKFCEKNFSDIEITLRVLNNGYLMLRDDHEYAIFIIWKLFLQTLHGDV